MGRRLGAGGETTPAKGTVGVENEGTIGVGNGTWRRGRVDGVVDGVDKNSTRMPQLDSATYFGQVTWLAVVFGLFYVLMLADVLPGVNRILKVRAKKLDRVRGDARQFDGVRVTAQDALDAQGSGAAKRVRAFRSSHAATVQGVAQAVVRARFGSKRRLTTGSSSSAVAKPVLRASLTTKAASKVAPAKAMPSKPVKASKPSKAR